ncbi:MAG: hypothetical protein ACP5IL_05745 [Syntrophobacteraceae bacterium]
MAEVCLADLERAFREDFREPLCKAPFVDFLPDFPTVARLEEAAFLEDLPDTLCEVWVSFFCLREFFLEAACFPCFFFECRKELFLPFIVLCFLDFPV